MRKASSELRVIFREEFRRQLRRPSFTAATLVIAAIMVIAIPVVPALLNMISPPSIPNVDEKVLTTVGYVDLAGILDNESLDSPKLYNDTATGIQAVQQGEIDTLFILPADYLTTGEVQEYFVSGEGRNLWSTSAELTFESYLRYNLAEGKLDNNTLSRILSPASYKKFHIEVNGTINQESNPTVTAGEIVIPTFFGIFLMITVLSGSGALLRSVYEEKETRMIEMLITTASPLSIMTGKLLALWSSRLIQIVVWVTVGAFALLEIFHRIPGGGELTISTGLLVTVLLSFVFGYFLFSALALLIASIVSSWQTANSSMAMLAQLIGLPIYLIGILLNIPNNPFVQILTWFPLSAPTMLMIRAATGNTMSGGEIAIVLGVIAATALLLLWIAARVFRAGILLSGQRITFRNVWRALRSAD
jgi:ABC-2 type transport system permease protein